MYAAEYLHCHRYTRLSTSPVTGVRGCSVEIKRLEPQCDYKFRVIVENKHGASEPSPHTVAHRLEQTDRRAGVDSGRQPQDKQPSAIPDPCVRPKVKEHVSWRFVYSLVARDGSWGHWSRGPPKPRLSFDYKRKITQTTQYEKNIP